MKLILLICALFLFLTGCSNDTNPVTDPELQYMTGRIFMVGSSSNNGLALICMENEKQTEYLMNFANKEAEDTAYYNQGKTAKVGYLGIYTSQELTYIKVKEVNILNN